MLQLCRSKSVSDEISDGNNIEFLEFGWKSTEALSYVRKVRETCKVVRATELVFCALSRKK